MVDEVGSEEMDECPNCDAPWNRPGPARGRCWSCGQYAEDH